MTAETTAQLPITSELYDADIIAWAEEQANLLRTGRLSELDIDHIASCLTHFQGALYLQLTPPLPESPPCPCNPSPS